MTWQIWGAFIWKAAVIVAAGTVLLRLAGRRSISQMTVSQTVLMISIGTLLIQPVTNANVWVSFGIGAVLVAAMLLIEYLQLKFDWLETLLTGKAMTVIENGVVNRGNLRKMRLSVDKLEMRLRQHNITAIRDVKWATIEPSGEMGYLLFEPKQPATKEDIQRLIDLLNGGKVDTLYKPHVSSSTDLFTEVRHGRNVPEPPKGLH